jgi:hypothetical protein
LKNSSVEREQPERARITSGDITRKWLLNCVEYSSSTSKRPCFM